MIILLSILLLNYIAVLADAITDSSIRRNQGVTWLAWHVMKWIRLYVPEAIILFLLYDARYFYFEKSYILWGLFYIFGGWLLWLIFYRVRVLE